MASREGTDDRAARLARERVQQAIREIRGARLGAGMTQIAVARKVDASRPRISRIERGVEPHVPADLLVRMAAVVGLDLAVKAYPGPDPALDAPQRELIRRFGLRIGPAWRCRTEVVLPLVGDKRAWDAEWSHQVTILVVHSDAEARLGDVQALLRRTARKRRDGGVARLTLLVADTRHNRAVLRAAAAEFAAAFPADPRHALACLRKGIDPGADALILV